MPPVNLLNVEVWVMFVILDLVRLFFWIVVLLPQFNWGTFLFKGAHLFSIETLPVRLSTTGSQLGSNATYVPSQEGGSVGSRFLYHIR